MGKKKKGDEPDLRARGRTSTCTPHCGHAPAQTHTSDGPVGIYIYRNNTARAMRFAKCTHSEFSYANGKKKSDFYTFTRHISKPQRVFLCV